MQPTPTVAIDPGESVMNRCNSISRLFATLAIVWLGVSASAATGCTIFVSHSDDASAPFWSFGSGSDDKMLFREAVEIAAGGVLRCFTDFEKGRISGGNFIHDPVFCGTVDNTRNWRLSTPINPGCGGDYADT